LKINKKSFDNCFYETSVVFRAYGANIEGCTAVKIPVWYLEDRQPESSTNDLYAHLNDKIIKTTTLKSGKKSFTDLLMLFFIAANASVIMTLFPISAKIK